MQNCEHIKASIRKFEKANRSLILKMQNCEHIKALT
jgi:hypothetical protein